MKSAAALLAAALLLAAPASATADGGVLGGAGTGSAAALSPVATSDSAPASASSTASTTDPDAPRPVPDSTTPPSGFALSAHRVLAIAARVPKLRETRARHRGSYLQAYTKPDGSWQVSLWSRSGKEIAQVKIADGSGRVLEAWTGYQVAWTMARGYDGAFGRRVNALYIWLPLCALFLLPFIPRRGRPGWPLVDALALLSLSVSLAFFNHAEIGLSVPLVYPPLIYLLVRALVVARRGAAARADWRMLVSPRWLAAGAVFLAAFHVGLNLANANVIDVGYASVVGADKLYHGDALYGHFPQDIERGDTYGPVTYMAYLPFRAIFGWNGSSNWLPAAHAAAIVFDLLTALGLWLLGRRIRGPTLGIVLAYCWLAFPFTLFVLNTNTNDGLVAVLVTGALLAATAPRARGILAALAGLAKFAPLALVPLLARNVAAPGEDPARTTPRSLLAYGLALLVTAAVVLVPVLALGNDLSTIYDRTLGYQHGRPAPFSVWGLWDLPDWLQLVAQAGAVALALGAAFLPRRRDLVQVAALAAAILIALQLVVTYWFYLYLVWFLPALLVALLGRRPEPEHARPPLRRALSELTPAAPAAEPAWRATPARD